MDVACNSDCVPQIELSARQSQAEWESQKRASFGSKLLSPIFSPPGLFGEPRPFGEPRSFCYGTPIAPKENEWKPLHLAYCEESARLKSFVTWPKQMNPKPEDLAKAGFFYEGVSDTCCCFHCGLLLHNWETDDDAIKEHYRHSPKCHFVKFQM